VAGSTGAAGQGASAAQPKVKSSSDTTGKKTPKPKVEAPAWVGVMRDSMTAIALLSAGFVLMLTVIGSFMASRDQAVLYDDLRSQLAKGIAPVSQLDADGALLTPGAPVAILDIPALGITKVVVEGTSSQQTVSGPGHRRDTVLPGQVGVSIIMGRQSAFGGPFGTIERLLVNDEITVTTGQGIAKYKVNGVRRPGDPLPQPLPAGGSRLTLITAGGPNYLPDSILRVDASLVETSFDGTNPVPTAFETPARVLGPNSLTSAEQPMAGDTSNVFMLVLWAQAFLLVMLAFAWMRVRWGRMQAWLVGVPLLLAVGLALGQQIVYLLPNLL